VIAVSQGVMFAIAIFTALSPMDGAANLVLQLCFLVVVLGLDVQVLWEVRRRIRPPQVMAAG
jgi:hypothetical protein